MLEAADLECERGGRILFRGLSFTLPGGELLRVAGANGSGKTSLLRILCGLLSPTAGEVRWKGSPARSQKEEYSKQLVYLGHAPAVKDDLSAAENLQIACTLAGIPVREDSIREALARFGLPEKGVFLKRLSQGQRKRAALARLALAPGIALWLLDEPFAALDGEAIERVSALCAAHLLAGGMLVLTSHQDVPIAAPDARSIELRG